MVVVTESVLPWIEKYRPKKFEDLISHKDILATINRFLKEDRLPHFLFYGPPGTGKTSAIFAIARQLYSKSEFSSMVLELNASDDRGIGVVREQILSFCSTKTIFSKGFKLIILDEADAMTADAQNALRRVIEKFTENARFCLICNYLSKIIPAIQSRCTRFRFGPLATDDMLNRLQYICKEEAVYASSDGLEATVKLSEGDMRRAIHILQSTAMGSNVVDAAAVYQCVGHPTPDDVKLIVDWLLNKSLSDAFQLIVKIQIEKGFALQDVLTEVHCFVYRLELSPEVRMSLLTNMADIEYRLCAGASEKMQLGAFVAAFIFAREQLKEEGDKE